MKVKLVKVNYLIEDIYGNQDDYSSEEKRHFVDETSEFEEINTADHQFLARFVDEFNKEEREANKKNGYYYVIVSDYDIPKANFLISEQIELERKRAREKREAEKIEKERRAQQEAVRLEKLNLSKKEKLQAKLIKLQKQLAAEDKK